MKLPEFTTDEEVMFFDTDCAGVMHNIAYLRMIETCRTHLGTNMGMDFKVMGATQLYPAVLRTEIDYRLPAKLGDKIQIIGKLSKIERVRFWCDFTITRPSDNKILVTCRQSLALVQMNGDKPAKPTRLPQEWKDNWAT